MGPEYRSRWYRLEERQSSGPGKEKLTSKGPESNLRYARDAA